MRFFDTKPALPLLLAALIGALIAMGVLGKCDRCEGQSLNSPKTVYVKVVDSSETGVPTKVAFTCHLMDASNSWEVSETHTQTTQGFDYFVAGTEVHHISIQCGNFQAFGWQAGDRLVIDIVGLATPFSMTLDANGEQYSATDLILPMIAPAGNLRLQIN